MQDGNLADIADISPFRCYVWLRASKNFKAKNAKCRFFNPITKNMPDSWNSPEHKVLKGKYVTLRPLVPERDMPVLHAISHGNPEAESIWNYLPYGPFASAGEMLAYYSENLSGLTDPLVWTAFLNDGDRLIGTTSFLNIVSAHGRAEIGHVWFTPSVHRTKANTESQYLLLKYLFDGLHYRRSEWKCDSLNHASRTAAARMGFVFEGRFRQHMMIRGKNRDTDWFAMTDKEWPRCRVNFERWLYSGERVSLMTLNNG